MLHDGYLAKEIASYLAMTIWLSISMIEDAFLAGTSNLFISQVIV